LRTSEYLPQFGYDLFDVAAQQGTIGSGAIANDYVLGIGDELVVTFQGADSRTDTIKVDREGRVILSNLPPIPGAGRTFGEFRRDLERRTAASFIGTQVFVSLGNVRQVAVRVVGEVKQPGQHRLTGLSSLLDALSLAGGIKKTGSLRRIQVVRGEKAFWIDLYDLLLGTVGGHGLALADGDSIVVPPLGPTIAIAGKVKRPGIYEFGEGEKQVDVEAALALGGGALRPEGVRVSHIRFDKSGQQFVTENAGRTVRVGESDVLVVSYSQDVQVGAVEVIGHVRVPGRRSLQSATTVRALVPGTGSLKDDPYLLFAALETTDPLTRARQLFGINLQRVIEGQEDFSLRDGDRLIVLGAADVRYLTSDHVQGVIQGLQIQERPDATTSTAAPRRRDDGQPATASPPSASTASGIASVREILGDVLASRDGERTPARPGEPSGAPKPDDRTKLFPCRGVQALATVIQVTRSGRFAGALSTARVDGGTSFVNPLPCPKIYDDSPPLLPFVLEHVVAVSGEVRAPGPYPVVQGTALISVGAAAGGLTKDVDLTRVEVSRFEPDPARGSSRSSREVVNIARGGDATAVGPGDVIRFNAVFTDRDVGPVQITGEVARPGLYDIRRGERLSQLIARAGGLTAQAYPYGTVFTRDSVRRAQQVGFERAARELNAALLIAAANSRSANVGSVQGLKALTDELKSVEAVGRVVIEADPTVLQVRPELDTVLEPGDRLFVPKRPNSILVIGDVLNPGAVQFIAGTKVDGYIRQAGGFQRSADQDRIFVVYPNGEAKPVSVSVWNYTPVQIPPGSTIVVPKEPAPLDLFTFARDISQVVSQLAVTAASLAVIGRN
jgi:protein involved in polysaccharide export with SLBB domain